MINLRRAYGPSMSRDEARRSVRVVFENLAQSLIEARQFVRRYKRSSGWESLYRVEDPAAGVESWEWSGGGSREHPAVPDPQKVRKFNKTVFRPKADSSAQPTALNIAPRLAVSDRWPTAGGTILQPPTPETPLR